MLLILMVILEMLVQIMSTAGKPAMLRMSNNIVFQDIALKIITTTLPLTTMNFKEEVTMLVVALFKINEAEVGSTVIEIIILNPLVNFVEPLTLELLFATIVLKRNLTLQEETTIR